MPMNWNIEDTLFYRKNKEKESDYWRIFNSMCEAICFWLYNKKIGEYGNRHYLEQCTTTAILTREDSEILILDFPSIFSFYDKYEKKLKETMKEISKDLVGMKVWAN